MEKTKAKTTTRAVKAAPKAQKTAKVAAPKTTENALTVKVYGVNGTVEKEINLPESIFNVEVHPHVLAQYVRVYLTNQRQGTVSTKTRSEVIGSTKKIYRQKGTGRARHGANKAPIFVGGGITFGPKPKEYDLKMNKKQKKQALLGAFSQKAKEQKIVVLAGAFEKMEPKTKTFVSALKALPVDSKKVLIMTSETAEKGLSLATRNIEGIKMKKAVLVNAYDIMANRSLLITEGGLELLVNALSK